MTEADDPALLVGGMVAFGGIGIALVVLGRRGGDA